MPQPDGALILSNGSVYKGHLFGDLSQASTLGEVVFQTGMVGYCQSLTDPSYHRQILVLTYPLIGNYGVPSDELESDRIWAAALICGELSQSFSHWNANQSLDSWMLEHKRPGLQGVDTRKLTKELRSHGTLVGKLVKLDAETTDLRLAELAHELHESDQYKNYPQSLNLVDEVSPKIDRLSSRDNVEFPRVLLIDCGAKNNIERCLLKRHVRVHRVPWNYDIIGNINSFDGILLSNGPGDPRMCAPLIDQLRQLIEAPDFNKPIFGICLGHQLLGLAAGFKTYKLPYGNRGHNQPCRFVGSQRCLITAQNHSYALQTNAAAKQPDEENSHDNNNNEALIHWQATFVNQNDGSNEGIAHRTKPFFSVQFHPEHNAGPHDSEFLFDIFLKSIENYLEDAPTTYSQVEAIREHLNQNQSAKPECIHKVLILGSGGLSIGQAGEFDYSGSQAIKALKSESIFTILINPNIATVQTSPALVDRVYFLPVTSHYVTEVIKRERPDGIMLMFGGQTALNCGIQLDELGVLRDYHVQVLGPTIATIRYSEDRKLFCETMAQIGVQVAPSCAVGSVQEALAAADQQLGYPILVRAAYALGGLGSGFAHDERELKELVSRALVHSSQVLLDKSLKGWKELEYEVVRDIYDNCATICNMENVDPLGIHTGESIVVAPSQTLSDSEYNSLRTTAIRIVRHLRVVGECNVQYAVNPRTSEHFVIEINPRLSRSSALASKATGYPLAYVAAKLALGRSLTELANAVTSSEWGRTTACFEPSLDYCVVKIPRWDLSKFAGVTHEIGSSMKSIGEVMAIGRSFEEAFQKALRMVGDSANGFDAYAKPMERAQLINGLRVPTDKRIFVLALAMDLGFSVAELYGLTAIDPWFLHKMKNIVDLKHELRARQLPHQLDLTTPEFGAKLLRAKRLGFSDKQIGLLIGGNELLVRRARCDHHNLYPFVKQVDTVAAEWPAKTNYLYLTYNAAEHDVQLPDASARRFATRTHSISQSQSPSPVKPPKPGSKLAERLSLANSLAHEQQQQLAGSAPPPAPAEASEQVLVLGSGVYRIGSSVEFDCCAVACVQELRRMGRQVLMLNYNPETVSTDFDECEKLYFDEISFEVVMDVYQLEQPLGVVLSMGGQTPNNIALQLHNQKVHILGTSPENIDNAEDRYKFSRMLDTHAISQPRWKNLTHLRDAFEFCKQVEYPCIVRPSYVLSGAAMNVAHSDQDLEKFLSQAIEVSMKHPVVISKFIKDAKEIDIDGVAQAGKLVCMAVSEHVENAGVHSGDATLVTPPQDLNKRTLEEIKLICEKIALALEVNGPFNIQLIAKDNLLKVIECNLRVSRSFPFVSKTLNYDFIATATKVIMGEEVEPVDVTFGQLQPRSNYVAQAQRWRRVGVKVPQFSFSRLSGADIKLGVEMASTGEVACFGDNRYSAYLKAMLSTGFRLPERKVVLISVGSIRQKKEFAPSVVLLARMGYRIYATQGTADYYNTKLSAQLKRDNIDFQLHWIDWPFGEVGSKLTTHDEIDAIAAYLSAKEFDLVINLPMRSAGARRVSTLGYRTRRFAVDHSVPLISDIKCAKLLIEALSMFNGLAPLVTDLDCLTSTSIITLPGLLDVHVHAREPGATHKEDFDSVTGAALAGGITFIGCMPNTQPPICDLASLKLAQELANSKARCDYGLIVGATPTNAKHLAALVASEPILALKMYLNTTYGSLCMSDMADWEPHFVAWPGHIPICVHAEGKTAAAAILFAQKYNKRVHICHVSSEEEILLIRHAKSLGVAVTCEVAPHHLFLTNEHDQQRQQLDAGDDNHGAPPPAEPVGQQLLGPKLGSVRPPLMRAKDQAALWANLDVIDCFATDHAPHLLAEKLGAESPPGFPGLETMLPLLLDATTQDAQPDRRLSLQQIVDKLHTNPKRIFNIPDQADTSIEVDMNQTWRIGLDRPTFSRAQWTPFRGRLVRGKLIKVTLRGQVAFVDDKLVGKPGTGRDLIGERDPAFASAGQTNGHAKQSELEPDSPEPITLHPRQQQRQVLELDKQQVAQLQPILQAAAHQQQVAAAAAANMPQAAPNLHYTSDLYGKHVLTIDMFNDRGILRSLFNLAERYFKDERNNRPIEPILAGKVLGTVFFEASTRTEWSFASAMMRLGGSEKHFDPASSSTQKGESLEDTMRVLSSYCHAVVLRHPEPGAVARAALVCDKPIINAGDGIGEHPTQALLDIFTMRKEIGTVTDRIISLVGDLKNGRTVHSLAKLLCNYEVGEIRLVSPKGLELPEEICQHMRERHVHFNRYDTLDEVVKDSDVIYMTRIQRERFDSEEEYRRCSGKLKVTPVFMAQNGAKDKMIVMHPLPRVDEISADFDSDLRAAYFRQAEYGLYVRMALLTMLLG